MTRSSFLASICLLLLACDATTQFDDADFIIQNARVFDGDTVHSSATIVINDGVVQSILLKGQTSSSGDNVIDGSDSTVVPGLINAHVHLKNFEQAEAAVQDGVLTLINMAGLDFPFQDAMRERGNAEARLPYFVSAGNMVTVTDGHGTQYVPYETVDSPADVADFVGRRVEEGSDFIKLTIERGDPWLRRPTLSDDMVAATIAAAHQNGLMAVAHITERADAIRATELGVDGLVHIWAKNFADDDPDMDVSAATVEDLDLISSSPVFIIPTITVFDRINDERGSIDIAAMKAEVGRLNAAGVPVLAGTDPPGYGINFGSDLYGELLHLTESGLTDVDALKAATSNTSRAFGLGDRGFIREGASADLLLITGDPTEDISSIRKISGIWKQGVRVK